jgi:hypothetical protein
MPGRNPPERHLPKQKNNARKNTIKFLITREPTLDVPSA